MKAVIQRVGEASVTVDGRPIAAIGPGLLVLLCVEPGDGEREVDFVARKTAQLRIFEDDAGKMNRSLADIGGGLLLVSQFTLAADTRSGLRPSFSSAARPEQAEAGFATLTAACRARHPTVETGTFRAHMQVSLVNDGPVTFWLESGQAHSVVYSKRLPPASQVASPWVLLPENPQTRATVYFLLPLS